MFRKKNLLPQDDVTSIGNLAVSKKAVTKEQLSIALTLQEESFPLGQVMLNHRMISEDQLKDLLLEQKLRRNKFRTHTVTTLYVQRARERIRDVSGLLREVAAVMRAFAASGK